MKQYHSLLEEILENGTVRGDRTGTGTISLFGAQRRYDMSDSFPLLTSKRVPFNAVLHELLWFLSGDTNVRYLQKHGVTIWDEWADEYGNLGPVYGHQWRSWPGKYVPHLVNDGGGRFDDMGDYEPIDQIANVIQQIRTNPLDRGMIVSAWNVGDLDAMALRPCHTMFQFYVREGKYLDCQLYQRSADMFLGVPFNIASYALLTHMIASICSLYPGEFIHTIGDAHIYSNHVDQVRELLSRSIPPPPKLLINPEILQIDDFQFSDFQLLGYKPHPTIKAPVAV